MIAIANNKLAAVVSTTLFVLLLFTGSASAFVRSSVRSNIHNICVPSSSTSMGVGNIVGLFDEGKKKLVKSLAGDYDAEAIQARTNGLIQDNPVLMLSFTTCPFCVKAKGVLDDMNAKYTVVELDADPDGKAIRAEMGDLIGRTSVPAIWIGQEFVGGCNDGPMGGVVKLNEEGKLEDMLKGVGSI
jgi:glutaredoxin 3